MAQVGARADLRSDMASAATEPRTVEPGAGVDPGPACVMRAHRDAIHPASHNASPDDITKTTPRGRPRRGPLHGLASTTLFHPLLYEKNERGEG